ncbi:uroporphyrinogen decarboxylase [Acidocella sp.]|uniref:uroporphyrinogen decarboxylase n=1 Tax=Acidocella sp. TaxID=50710 RepID=UPI001793FD0F|nr:uroporphyrinogen decarboxylase [Acidocella sp.]NNM57401.1 uroporphyrinogen decarboxylase [Acidocella sp.]
MKLLHVLNNEAISPPPVWLMRQAGRYLPEYRAVRGQAGDFISLCLNPELATEVTLQPIRRYGFDAAILFSDILILPMALGQGLRFAEGEGPLLPPLQNTTGLNIAAAPDVYAPVLETVRRVRAALPPETALIGFAGGPATVACYMLDGKGGGEFPRTRALAYENPALVQSVLDILAAATITYLQGQITAGANCVMLFESWAGIFPAPQFRQFVIEPNRRIVAALKSANPGIKIIGFPRLCGLLLGEYVRETGVDAVSLDTVTDPAAAIAACPPGTVFQGNLDPLLLKSGGAALETGVTRLLQAFRGIPHVFNLGHGITPEVPPENIARLMELIRNNAMPA